jgi:integrase
VSSITRRDVRDVIERVFDRGAPVMANRTLEIVRKMFNWGIKNDYLEASPAALIDKPGVEQSRDRVLTDDEIRQLWRCLSHFPETHEKQAPGRKRAKSPKDDPFCPLSPTLAVVQKLRLLTAQRGGEVVAMRWADLDLDTGWWTISAEHSKNGEAHRVPLSTDALALIRAQLPKDDHDEQPEHVFVGRGDALVSERLKKAGAALSRVLGFEFRSHDLRRTAATRLAAAGIPREHISAVLNHVQGGPSATRIYDRYGRDQEKRIALDTWARVLAGILAAAPAKDQNVVPITKARRA